MRLLSYLVVLHLCAVDALVGVGPDGKEKDYVLELNDSPIGFTPGFWEADTKIVISMALEEMNKLYRQ
jgi:glutathione synthase/RimK-type ligase-like ATP-grasp enzyme